MAEPTSTLSWAELTECMETDSDFPSESKFIATTEKSKDETEMEDFDCKQMSFIDLRKEENKNSECGWKVTTRRNEDEMEMKDFGRKQMSDNDLRKKLNTNRDFHNDEFQATTSKSKSQTKSVGKKHAQRKPSNDLRTKLNINRGEAVYESSEPQRERHSPLDRPKYTERPGGLSPLRSPISKLNSIFDMDNSRSFRFTKHRVAPSQKVSPSRNGENRHDLIRCMRSPYRSERDKRSVKSDGIDTTPNGEESEFNISLTDCNRDTPRHDLTPTHNSRQPWSRRKLHLPSENNGSKDAASKRKPQTKEDDVEILARREKNIAYGKNTNAYQVYITEVPVEQRIRKLHPSTPDKFKKCSRRSWDAQVKSWKRQLHALKAKLLNKERALVSDILQDIHLLDEDSSLELQSDEDAFLDAIDDEIIDLSDKTILI